MRYRAGPSPFSDTACGSSLAAADCRASASLIWLYLRQWGWAGQVPRKGWWGGAACAAEVLGTLGCTRGGGPSSSLHWPAIMPSWPEHPGCLRGHLIQQSIRAMCMARPHATHQTMPVMAAAMPAIFLGGMVSPKKSTPPLRMSTCTGRWTAQRTGRLVDIAWACAPT